ncbi:hypothetical protein KV692_06835 [Xanthomonas euvesicatoria pv. physalidis]|uniref:hypothetical protein n=1 Tax=Xanthomonas euvesicatoria TaxID=456327 RepID=UPI001C482A67|nr:hypothetical protein [Xanthomonas euvesicatoria]MBV6687589.1 hypothetical protein [Xanthomonas euvesicatoria pv. physalidis]
MASSTDKMRAPAADRNAWMVRSQDIGRDARQSLRAWCGEQALRLDQLEEGMTAAAHEPASSACRKRRIIGLKQANKTLRVNRMVAWAACPRQPRRADSGGLMLGKRAAHKQKATLARRPNFRPPTTAKAIATATRFYDSRFPIPDSRFPIP